jgi:hypothetical protein
VRAAILRAVAKSWPIPTKAFRKNLDSGYFAAEGLGVDGEFDENNEEDLSSLRVQQKFRLLSAMTST